MSAEVCLERVKGIEPSYAAWEAAVLPLNYTRFEVRRHYRRSACTGKRIFKLCDGLLSDCFPLMHLAPWLSPSFSLLLN